jgi:formylglycine-generating enzyme required for sulfatase activity
MADHQIVDITELAVLGEQFPLRLMRLGFRLMQAMDEKRQDLYRYVLPPICEVPAGPFLMGSDPQQDPDAKENELPQRTVTLPTYHLATYPLTVAEYTCFVQTTGYPEPSIVNLPWHTQLTEYTDHPVVCVSWHDVASYAHWLAHVTGESWRMPTETEWEKAARGTDGRIFPWGNQWDQTRAKLADRGLWRTLPVGSYPNGASPYGVQDMVGNIFEWTSTPYYPQTDDENLTNRTYHIVRSNMWGQAKP